MKDFRKIKVWDKAHRLTLAIYEELISDTVEIRKMLTAFIKKLRADS